MYSRNVSFKLKSKCSAEFTSILEGQIIPLLRRQKGFEDEISFIAPERNVAWRSVFGRRRMTPRRMAERPILRS